MKSSAKEMKTGKEGFFQHLRYKYLPYWYVFLIMLLLCGGLAYYFLKATPNLYETSASVLIRDVENGTESSRIEQTLDPFRSQSVVGNERELLRSGAAISKIVKDLRLYAPITEKDGIKTISAYYSCPVLVEARKPDSLLPTTAPMNLRIDKAGVNVDGQSFVLNQWKVLNGNDIRFINNPNYRRDASKPIEERAFSFSLLSVLKTSENVLDGLITNATSRQSSVIDLKIRDEVPARGEAILSEVINAYLLGSVEKKNSTAARTLEWLNNRIKEEGGQLDSIEKRIQSYRTAENVVDMSEQSRLYLQRVEAGDRQLNEMSMQLASLNEMEKYINSKKAGGLVPSTSGVANQELSTLMQKLYDAEVDYQRLSKTTAENNPMLTARQNEIDKMRPGILEAIQTQRRSLLASREQLGSDVNQYSGMLRTVPQKERALLDVSRQRNMKQEQFNDLLRQRDQILYSLTSTEASGAVINKPTTLSKPVSPKKELIALLALIAPFGLGALFVSAKDAMNGKVLYRDDLNSLTGYPIIGELIESKDAEKLITEPKRSFLLEQFRQIRTTVFSIAPNAKKIMVTSSIEGEGKSFVSSNLALSMARSGKRICLLEFDLHRPKVSEQFGVSNEKGITDILADGASVQNLIQRAPAHSNLFILPSGGFHESVSDLITKEKLDKLIADLANQFDCIIIDTPPVRALNDAFVIGKETDLTLYVTRHNYTPKSYIGMLEDSMTLAGIRNIALIFNGVKNRGIGKNSYGVGYGYGHENKTAYEGYWRKAGA